ncbi:MAG: GWxTD domain-containing protein [Bacteroidota bacterium]|nr:GWxTD domain-containing protein [Bacteroidota bacterium]
MKVKYFFLIVIICALFQWTLNSQTDFPPVELPDLPRFYFDALCYDSGELGVTRLDIYLEVPYEGVNFTKKGDTFRASYEVSLSVYDSVETLVDEKWWTEKLEVKDYNQTISQTTSNLSQRSFLLTPGLYYVVVQIRDNETNKLFRQKRKIRVRKFYDQPFALSDIMLVSNVKFDSGKTIIFPNISGNVGNLRDTFYLFFETYSNNPDTASFFVNIHNMKDDIVQRDSFLFQVGDKKQSCFHKIMTSKLIAGDYLLQIKAVINKTDQSVEESERTASSSRTFIIRWRGMPTSVFDLDEAIEQLQYIADRKTVDEMRNAQPEKKREMYQEFWKKKDPTQKTERNELMEEYYARVAYANKNFSHYTVGWKTDMGMIYIIFGSPSNIERHPFNIDSKPYEIWTYYEINREFIFVDVTGFGDYRLQNPIWDLYRTRPR